ncbi:hypothetical protein BCS84_06495 [Vibrio cyclitrophicus]|uniref:hypothetical protein n=1 Tax=Vibrio cyclitrophicus TaxID=47951 RepID=UPI000C822C68|nr:hypothetical protein [Vibrio cyclitrophicus]PMP49399.1 hypothetical protein BCS84_06485 [Vibrio cyclitrophicus]
MSDLSLSSSLPAFLGQEGSIEALRDKFALELEKNGYSKVKGTSIDEYAKAFRDLATAPKSAKALQDRIGGDFHRVAIAYKILTKATKPSPLVRDKSAWFLESEKRLNKVLTDEMLTVWTAFDTEVQNLVSVRVQESINQISGLESENKELIEFIDDLQKQAQEISSLQANCHKLETKLAHTEQVSSDYLKALNTVEKELKTLLLVKSELTLMQSRYEMMEKQCAALAEDKQRLIEDNTKFLNMVTHLQKHRMIEPHELNDDYLSDEFDPHEFSPEFSEPSELPQST